MKDITAKEMKKLINEETRRQRANRLTKEFEKKMRAKYGPDWKRPNVGVMKLPPKGSMPDPSDRPVATGEKTTEIEGEHTTPEKMKEKVMNDRLQTSVATLR